MFTTNHQERLLAAIGDNPAYRTKMLMGSNGDAELEKYYTFDELGHIMVATTSKNQDTVDPALQKVMGKVMVFFGAWTAALTRAGTTLFDFDAVNKIIGKSGYFINTQKEERSFSSSSTAITLDTEIIQNVLSGGVTGGGLAIAKRTLAAIGNQIKISFNQTDVKKEIAHLLFVVESLMGCPIVSISLFHTKLEQMSWVSNTNCSSISHNQVNFNFSGDDYYFVDPSLIEQCTPEFRSSEEYENLIKTLMDYLSPDA